MLVLGVTALGAAVAYAVSLEVIPVYKSSGTLLVTAPPQQAAEGGAVLSASQVTSTYATLATARPLLSRVINELNLPPETPDTLSSRIKATPERDAQILDIEVADTDAQRAARVANTLMTDFVEEVTAQNKRRIDQAGAVLTTQINDLEKDLADSETRLSAAERAKQDTSALADKIRADNALLAQLATAYSTFSATQAQGLSNLSVVSAATTPTSPASPRPVLNTALGAIAGLMLGGGLAALLEYLDQGLRTDEDVRRRLGVTTLGIVPAYSISSRNSSRAHRNNDQAAEAYRRLRTNLRFASVDRSLTSVVVTSARQGEGKSCTSANLARAVAASGQRVLLVDCDMRRPSQHTMFSQPLHNGMSELLLHASSSGPTLNGQHHTQFANLSVLTAGTIPPNPSELLASRHMPDLLKKLESDYDLVILDTPPAGAVTDGLSLAATASATLLVIEAGRTGARQARETVDALRAVGANLIGIVLNKARDRNATRYYYAYYRPERPPSREKARARTGEVGAEPMPEAWTPMVAPRGAGPRPMSEA